MLDGVSFAVEPAELFALIGPNGAGKTSVLQLHQRHLSRPRAHPLSAAATSPACRPRRVARLGIARTFQHVELFGAHERARQHHGRPPRAPRHQSAGRGAVPRRVRREEVEHREAVERIIEFVELEGVRYAHAGALPFGIQKIVGLARALALEPSLLLLDEPSAGLTRDERDDLARFILRIKHDLKLPMIWIEHDMQMVADLADRIHVLNYGRTLAAGAPDEVLQNPAVVAAYLGKVD